MIQIAANAVPQECSSLSKLKRNTFLSSGRRGSGNIRCPQDPVKDKRPVANISISIPSPQERQSTSTADKKSKRSEPPTGRSVEQRRLTSSGRGGSGNIQPTTRASDLEAHPLTAAILSQHSAMQAQYEQWVRKNRAEVNVVRSSGRGGSGNISDARRRSRSQGPSATPKKHFFTTKGRDKGTMCHDGIAQARDGEGGNQDKRTSYATYSSGGSSNLESRRHSHDSRISNAVGSSINSATTDPSSSEDAAAGRSGRNLRFSFRWSKPSSSTSSVAPPGPPRSCAGSPGLSSRVCSPTSIILEDQEYVSFLEL